MFFITPTLETWGWGTNGEGQLGQNTKTSRSSPVLVVGNFSFVNMVGSANSTTVFLRSDGTAWTSGFGTTGGLGNDTTTGVSSPVAVVGSHSFIRVHAGISGYALKANGEIWSWGQGANGSLGNDTTTSVSSPVLVVGGIGFSYVAGKASGAYAIQTTTGNVWSWGAGTSGQNGNNSTTARSSPVAVVGSHSFIKVASSNLVAYGIALKSNGEVWSWGLGSSGQLGNNSTTSRSSPVLVVGSHSFIDIACAANTAYGLKSNGEVWSWGAGAGLGNNTTTAVSSPVLVVGSHSFTQIAGDESTAYALKANGEVWSWGSGTGGALGDNTTTAKSSPVLVVGGITASYLAGYLVPSGPPSPTDIKNFNGLPYASTRDVNSLLLADMRNFNGLA